MIHPLAFTISDTVFWSAVAAIVAALWGSVLLLFSMVRRMVERQLADLREEVGGLRQKNEVLERRSERCEHDRELLYQALLEQLPPDKAAYLQEAWDTGDTHVDAAPGTPEHVEFMRRLQMRRERTRYVKATAGKNRLQVADETASSIIIPPGTVT